MKFYLSANKIEEYFKVILAQKLFNIHVLKCFSRA